MEILLEIVHTANNEYISFDNNMNVLQCRESLKKYGFWGKNVIGWAFNQQELIGLIGLGIFFDFGSF